MKTAINFALLTVLATAITSTANAQQISFGPVDVNLDSQSFRVDFNRIPSPFNNNQVIPQPLPQPSPYHRGLLPPYNPVIQDQAQYDMVYDRFSRTWKPRRKQISIHDSARDPNRNVVDPGSMRYSTRWEYRNGVYTKVISRSWTSYGVPHSDTKVVNESNSHRDERMIVTAPAPTT